MEWIFFFLNRFESPNHSRDIFEILLKVISIPKRLTFYQHISFALCQAAFIKRFFNFENEPNKIIIQLKLLVSRKVFNCNLKKKELKLKINFLIMSDVHVGKLKLYVKNVEKKYIDHRN